MKPNRKAHFEGTHCPAPEDVVAAVLDGGDARAEGETIREHVRACERCRGLLEETSDTVGVLRHLHTEPLAYDLVEGVLARIPETAWADRSPAADSERVRLAFPRSTPVRIAAAALILIGAFLLFRYASGTLDGSAEPTGPVVVVDQGIGWLLSGQLPSGGWDVEEWGGRPEYGPALNGLAVLALTRADGRVSERATPLRKAAAFLVQTQAENGRFGRNFDGTMYNQGIATLALLKSYCVTRHERLRDPITRAVAFICSRQSVSGGWGYRNDEDAPPNTSITAWQIQALLLADRLGWQEHRLSIRKALAWLSGTVDGSGYFGYERPEQFPDGPGTLTMMGAHCLFAARRLDVPVDPVLAARVMQGIAALAGEKPDDYYGAYFYSSALSEADSEAFADALAAARASLIARQQTTDSEPGPWPADDRWGRVGGQIYSTSMALLALTPPERPPGR